MAFEAQVNGHKIMLDAGEQFGGRNLGPRPKPLMLVALAGCTAMDVISILTKMRVGLDNFDLKVEYSLFLNLLNIYVLLEKIFNLLVVILYVLFIHPIKLSGTIKL